MPSNWRTIVAPRQQETALNSGYGPVKPACKQLSPRAANALDTAALLYQPRLSERAMVDRLESLCHPQVGHQLSRRDDPAMCNLKLGFPWPQLNFCPPDRTDQYQTFLRARKTLAAAEAKKSRVAHDGTRLFPYLPAKRLLPGLVTLATATWPSPSLTIPANQHDSSVSRHTQTICPMSLTHRRRGRRIPSDHPIAGVRPNHELFAIACGTMLKHSYLHSTVAMRPRCDPALQISRRRSEHDSPHCRT